MNALGGYSITWKNSIFVQRNKGRVALAWWCNISYDHTVAISSSEVPILSFHFMHWRFVYKIIYLINKRMESDNK